MRNEHTDNSDNMLHTGTACPLCNGQQWRTNEMNSAVDHPSHYNKGGIECIDAMEAAFGDECVMDFCLCNSFKYLYRCMHKNRALEDLKKAQWYLTRLIDTIEKKELTDLPSTK